MITLLLVLLAVLDSTQAARAQPLGKSPKVGILARESRPSGRIQAFLQGLRDLGHVEGQNIIIEYRGSEDVSKLEPLAIELVREKVDVINKRLVYTGQGTHLLFLEKNRMNLFREVQLFLDEPHSAG